MDRQTPIYENTVDFLNALKEDIRRTKTIGLRVHCKEKSPPKRTGPSRYEYTIVRHGDQVMEVALPFTWTHPLNIYIHTSKLQRVPGTNTIYRPPTYINLLNIWDPIPLTFELADEDAGDFHQLITSHGYMLTYINPPLTERIHLAQPPS